MSAGEGVGGPLDPTSSSPMRAPSPLVGAIVSPAAPAGAAVGEDVGVEVAAVTSSSNSLTTPSPFVSPGKGAAQQHSGERREGG